MNAPADDSAYFAYIGPNPGIGEIHKVISVTEEEVITIGEKHSWLGTPDLFSRHFRRVTAPNQ